MSTLPALPDPTDLDGQEKVGARGGTAEQPLWVASTPCSPIGYSRAQLHSPHRHLPRTQASSSSSSSSASGSISDSASSSSRSSHSSQLGSRSHAGSHASSHACSDASDCVDSIHTCSSSLENPHMLDNNGDTVKDGAEDVPSNDEASLFHGALSLPELSATDDEDAQKVIACEAVWKSNTQYGTWQDELIHQGKEDIALRDKTVHSYAEVSKSSKALDKIGPPLTYMEVHRGIQGPGYHCQSPGVMLVLSHGPLQFNISLCSQPSGYCPST